jgi:processive 1,2-diacylglycerol beta-glucosyltransferase
LMSQADLLVTKPGGLTCSEAMACGLPTLLLRPLPGHEEENAAYLTRTGAALIADEHDVGTMAHTLLSAAPERLIYMRERARLAGRPTASQTIAADILLQSQANLYRNAHVS